MNKKFDLHVYVPGYEKNMLKNHWVFPNLEVTKMDKDHIYHLKILYVFSKRK